LWHIRARCFDAPNRKVSLSYPPKPLVFPRGPVFAKVNVGTMNNNLLPPNFDDERTLLSARKVVPLNRIDAKVRRRRRWFLGGAFAVAMILGAASALVAARLALRNVPVATATPNEVLEEDVAPAPLAAVQNVPSPTPADSPAAEKEPVTKRRAVVKHAQQPVTLPDEPRITEEERLQQIRDAVLYDQWQEQRARRVMRRERRLDRYNHRDLSNLDEIFEGRRKRP